MTLSILFNSAIMFALPCWIANVAFSLAYPLRKWSSRLRGLDRPLDNNIRYRGQPFFGPSRTWLGLLITLVVAMMWGIISQSGMPVLQIMLTFVGTLLGSFIKRQLRFPPGKMVLILDQADYLFFVGLIWYLFFDVQGAVVVIAAFLTIIGTPFFSVTGYALGLKSKPY